MPFEQSALFGRETINQHIFNERRRLNQESLQLEQQLEHLQSDDRRDAERRIKLNQRQLTLLARQSLNEGLFEAVE